MESNYFFNSSDNLAELFKAMFHDSSIAKNYQMKTTKLSYICNFGIAPYEKSILINKVQENTYYAFSFDERFNIQLQKKLGWTLLSDFYMIKN